MADIIVEAVKAGSTPGLELAIQKFGVEVNKPNRLGGLALAVAAWRNDVSMVGSLLAAGADPDKPDAESGWTSLHRALYYSNLCVAAALLQAGASLDVQDYRGRTPLDLLTADSAAPLAINGRDEGANGGDGTTVHSWGNGANYQLGTGSTDLRLGPGRVDVLQHVQIVQLAAAKFHSAAVAADGKLYTWGWGRGGRLGHPDTHIHSGQGAQIHPRVVSGLGRRVVVSVGAAKHHTVVATSSGEVFTWGSNRDGRLGFAAVDTQPTPRKVALLKQRVVAVAAANKHSAAVSAAGEVFTWGANMEGQLGYGTSDSASNPVPRLVESMKGRCVVAVAVAKRHTVVLTGGEVHTWGHKVVTPKRVQLTGARDVARGATGEKLRFHRGQADVARPVAVAIAAGAAHTSCLTHTGVVLTWRSDDPNLVAKEVGGALACKRLVGLSAGKTRTAVVTDDGGMYIWEAPTQPSKDGSRAQLQQQQLSVTQAASSAPGASGQYMPQPSSSPGQRYFYQDPQQQQPQPAGGSYEVLEGFAMLKGFRAARAAPAVEPVRVMGVKGVTQVAVGEKHSLALQLWRRPPISTHEQLLQLASADRRRAHGAVGSDSDMDARDMSSGEEEADSAVALAYPAGHDDDGGGGMGAVASLQETCQRAVAQQLVEPRTVLQVLEYADMAGAALLREFCMGVALASLDAVLLQARAAFEAAPFHLLAELEHRRKTGSLIGERHLDRTAAAEETPSNASWASILGSSPLDRAKPAASRSAASHLPPSCRPTAAPSWLDSATISTHNDMLPSVSHSLAEAARSALDAYKGRDAEAVAPGVPAMPGSRHGSAGVGSSTPATAGTARSSGEGFTTLGQLELAAESEAAQKLQRGIARKLQQIRTLEEQRAGGVNLDAQQMAKLSQRTAWEEADAALEAGAGVAAVQDMLSQIQSTTAKLLGALPRQPPDAPSATAPSPAPSATDVGGSGSSRSSRSQVGAAGDAAGASTSAVPSAAAPAVARAATSAPASLPPSPSAAREVVSPEGLMGLSAEASSDSAAGDGFGDGSGGKRKQRRGGLSMFLSGALDKPQPAALPPAAARGASPPHTKGPAWGGAGVPAAAAPPSGSLRELLSAADRPRPATAHANGASADHATSSSTPAASAASAAAAGATASSTRMPQQQSSLAAPTLPAGATASPGTTLRKPPKTPAAATAVATATPPLAVPPHALSSPSATAHDAASSVKLSLAEFLGPKSSPIPLKRSKPKSDPSPSAAAAVPWGGILGSSPPASSGRSLLDIQAEQERQRLAALWGGTSSRAAGATAVYGSSPTGGRSVGGGQPAVADAATAGASAGPSGAVLGTSPQQGGRIYFDTLSSPAAAQTKWYNPEPGVVRSLAEIQSEEAAMQLQRQLDEAAAAQEAAVAAATVAAGENVTKRPDGRRSERRRQQHRPRTDASDATAAGTGPAPGSGADGSTGEQSRDHGGGRTRAPRAARAEAVALTPEQEELQRERRRRQRQARQEWAQQRQQQRQERQQQQQPSPVTGSTSEITQLPSLSQQQPAQRPQRRSEYQQQQREQSRQRESPQQRHGPADGVSRSQQSRQPHTEGVTVAAQSGRPSRKAERMQSGGQLATPEGSARPSQQQRGRSDRSQQASVQVVTGIQSQQATPDQDLLQSAATPGVDSSVSAAVASAPSNAGASSPAATAEL